MSADFSGQRVLITGATGFIGRRLARALAARRGEVIAVGRRPCAEPQVASVICDLENADALRTIVREYRPDYVYHLAAYVTAKEDPSLVLPMMHSDLNASVALLSALGGSGCRRVIQAGTCLEVDDGEIPLSPYGVAKACSRLYAMYYAQHLDVPVVHARLDMTYGPGQPAHRLIPYLIATARAGETPVLRDPERRFACVHVDDAVEALMECGVAPSLAGQTIDIAGDQRVTIREIARLVEAILRGDEQRRDPPTAAETPAPSAPGHPSRNPAWTWRPQIGLVAGLTSAIAAFPRSLAREAVL